MMYIVTLTRRLCATNGSGMCVCLGLVYMFAWGLWCGSAHADGHAQHMDGVAGVADGDADAAGILALPGVSMV